MPQRLLKQLNRLNTIRPDSDWQERTRAFLVSRARIDTMDRQPSFMQQLQVFSLVFYRNYLPSPYKMVAVLTAVAILGGTSLMAKAEYVPQRPLYTVKRVVEKMEFVFAVSAESETKVHLKHAKARQVEAVKIMASATMDAGKKAENLNAVMKSLEQNITAAKNTLEIVKSEEVGEETGKTAALAQQITEGTASTLETVNQVKTSSPTDEVAKTATQVETAAEDVNTVSLQILVDNNAEGQAVSPDQVKIYINQKLERNEEKIKAVEVLADSLGAVKNYSDTGVTVTHDLKLVTDKADQAQKIVREAKTLLEGNDLNQALAKVEKVTDLAKESTKAIQEVKVLAGSEEKTEVKSSTSQVLDKTQPLLPDGQKGTSTIKAEPEILNFAPLGGRVNQAATYTMEIEVCFENCALEK